MEYSVLDLWKNIQKVLVILCFLSDFSSFYKVVLCASCDLSKLLVRWLKRFIILAFRFTKSKYLIARRIRFEIMCTTFVDWNMCESIDLEEIRWQIPFSSWENQFIYSTKTMFFEEFPRNQFLRFLKVWRKFRFTNSNFLNIKMNEFREIDGLLRSEEVEWMHAFLAKISWK